MTKSNVVGVLVAIGACGFALILMGGREPCPPPCTAEFNACALQCDGPAEAQCRFQGEALVCMAPPSCNPAEECKDALPLPVCYERTCSYLKRCLETGIYECNERVCCIGKPSAENTPCPGPGDDPAKMGAWTGSCDGAGKCNAPPCPAPCTTEGAACALTCRGPIDGQCVKQGDALACIAP